MKKLIIYLLIACSIAMMNSCSKSFLDEHLVSTYAPQNTLKDSLGFDAAIVGLMNLVRTQYTYAGDQGLICTMYIGTDECEMTTPAAATTAMFPYVQYNTMNSQDGAASYYWSWAYRVINNANQIIQAIEDPNLSGVTQTDKNRIDGEARFYRAYAYEFLNTLWGDVPLIDKPVTSARTDFTRTPTDSIISFIIQDLKFAEANLPDPDFWISIHQEDRMNKYAAMQLLAEVYLRANQPALAKQECLNIINSGKFSLITQRYGVKKNQPGDPFSDMFVMGNERRSQGNTEAIWVIEEEHNVPGGSTGSDQHRRVWVTAYYNIPGMIICDSLGGRGIGRMRLTNYALYGIFDTGDMRNSPYNIRRALYYNDPSSPKYGQRVILTGTDTMQKSAPYLTKWNSFYPDDIFGYSTDKDLIMMRLGETYLLLAEAQMKLGDLSGAAASINVLRQRAHTSLIQPSDITMDFILDERLRELMGEENRRMTLVRTGTLISRTRRFGEAAAASTIQDYNALLPIPQSEIDLNKSATLTQNPGY